MCDPIFYLVKSVVTESVFCVVNGIVALVLNRLYAGVLIKKFRYWTKSVPWDIIYVNFGQEGGGCIHVGGCHRSP